MTTTIVVGVPPTRSTGGVVHAPAGSKSYFEKPATSGKRMTLTTEAVNSKIYIPYAPQNIKYSGFGMRWNEVAREGVRKPLLVAGGLSLKKMSFDIDLAEPTRTKTWDKWLRECEAYSVTGARIKVEYGSVFEGVWWRLTGFSFDSVFRHPNTNGIMEAKVYFEFTESQDPRPPSGPVTGGLKGSVPVKVPPPPTVVPPPTTPPKTNDQLTMGIWTLVEDGTSGGKWEWSEPESVGSGVGSPGGGGSSDSVGSGVGTPVGGDRSDVGYGTPKRDNSALMEASAKATYVVKAGDTLSGIAVKMYRNSSMWATIAAYNGIKNPANLKVGTVLRIP